MEEELSVTIIGDYEYPPEWENFTGEIDSGKENS